MASGVDADGFTALTRAVESGNVGDVKSLIDEGSDVNTSDGKGSPLFCAAKNGHLTISKLLVEAGANVNAFASDHSMPLIEAARGKHADCVDELIQAGAIVNVRDDKKVTPLIAAIGNISCMDILVKAGAQLNPKVDGVTRNPLLEAIDKNDTESVKFLMEKGAKVPPADQCESYELYFDTNIKTTPLLSTIESKNIDMFNTLVEGGADLKEGILTAASFAHHRGLELMIERGADVNCADKYGNTVLMRVAYEFDKDYETTVETRLSCVKLVLKKGARVNKMNQQERNALERCLKNNPLQFTEDLARLLFAAGEKIQNAKPESDILKKLKEEEDEMSLQAMCRKSIRKYLLDLNPHLSLFQRVPNLGLPGKLIKFMYFEADIDDDEDADDNDNA